MALDDDSDLFDPPARPKQPSNKIVYQPPGAQWSLSRLPEVESLYRSSFNKQLPLANKGQGSIHNKWGYDHRNSADVSINPSTPEGQQFTEQLKKANIPFLAFTGAIPGVATGPHIHIGFPSQRAQQKFNVGAQKKSTSVASDDLFDSPQSQQSDNDLFDSPEQSPSRTSAGTRKSTPPRATAAPASTKPSRYSFSGKAFAQAAPEQRAQIRAGVGEFETAPLRTAIENFERQNSGTSNIGALRRLDDPEARRITRIQQQAAAQDPASAKLLPARLARRAAQQASQEREDELKAQANEPQLRELTDIYRRKIREAKGLGIGPEQWLNEAGAKGAAGLTELAAGAFRGVSPALALTSRLLSDPNRADIIAFHAQAMQRAAEEEGADRNRVSRAVQNIVGGIISSAPELAMMSAGVPPMAAFGAGGAARSVGRGDRPLDVVKAGAHGVATGGAFELPLPQIANPLTRTLTRAGTTGVATGGLEAQQGAPLDQAIEAGLTNAFMSGYGEVSRIRNEPSALERGLARETPRERVEPDAAIASQLRGGRPQVQPKDLVDRNRNILSRPAFREHLFTESVGGNAGPNRAAVNMLVDGSGQIVFIGNFQDAPGNMPDQYRSGKLKNVSAIVHWPEGLTGNTPPVIERVVGPEPFRATIEQSIPPEWRPQKSNEPQIQTKPPVEAQRRQLSEQEIASVNSIRQHLNLVSDHVDDLGKRYITYDLKLPGKEPVRVVIASESSAMRHVEVGMGSIRPDTALPDYLSPRVDLGTRRALALKRVLQQLHPEIESVEFHRVGSTGGEQERHRTLRLRGETNILQTQAQSPVEAQRAEAESAEGTSSAASKPSMVDVSGRTDLGRDVSQESTTASQRFFHRDYGEVSESPNQKQVGKGRVRVVDENGREHVIKRAAMTGAGNQRAVPIREPATEPSTPSPTEVNTQPPATESQLPPAKEVADVTQEAAVSFAEENRRALQPHLKPVREFWRELGFKEGARAKVVATKQEATVLGEGIVPDRIAVQFDDGNIADLKPSEMMPKEVTDAVAESPLAPESQRPTSSIAPEGVRPAPAQWEVPREPLSAKSVTEPVTEPKLPETTSIKNAATEELRADLNLSDIARPEKRAWQTSIDNAQAKGLDKQVDQIADKVIKGNREVALDLEESAALLIKIRELENQWEQVYRANPADPKLAEIKSQLDKYSAAADMGGTETARALNFRRAMVDKEFRLISLIRQAEKAKGREVTPVEVARYEQIVRERDTAIAQRDAALERARVADLQRQIDREGRRTRRTEQKKTLDDEAVEIKASIAAELARLKAQRGQGQFTSMAGLGSLDPDGVITKNILKYARNRIKANVGLKAEALIDEVHDLVKDLGATRQQVAEALARGRQRQQQRDEVTRRLAEIRREIASMVNEADVAAGRRSLKQEGPKRDYQRNQQRLKQLEQREAEYERRIREHDFEPKERKEFPYSPEVRAAERRVEIAEAKFYKEMKRAEGGHQLRNLSGIYKAWLLSSPLTHVKNIGGTMGYQVFSEGARLPSVIADAALSTVTGQRGISGPSPSAMLESVSNAIRVGGREAIDIMRQGATKEQMERHQYQEIDFGVNTGKPAIDKGVKVIELAHNAIFRFMSASDRVSYQFALKRNLVDRANIQARNEGLTGEAKRARVKELAERPPEQLEADAKHDALVATFNNNNALSTKIKAARAATIKNPNLNRKAAQRINAAENLALDLVLPFDRTPTNVVMRILEASPAGYLKNAGQLVKAAINKTMTVEDQRQFSQTFGKATAGTALIALGWKLADELFDVDDKGIVSLKLGSRRIKLDYISPLGNLIATGVRLRKAHDEEKGPAEDARIVGKEVSNIPVFRATSALSELVQDPARAGGRTAARLAFGAVPFSSMTRFVGDVLDPKEREAKGFKENFQRNVPIWRQQLPEHVDRRRQRAELGEDVRMGRKSAAELEQMVRDGQITEARKQQILRDSKLSAKQARFNDYTPSVALDRYERMDAAHQEEVREQMEKKAWNLTHSDTLTDQQKAEFQERLDRLGITPREPKKSSGSFKDLFRQSASPF